MRITTFSGRPAASAGALDRPPMLFAQQPEPVAAALLEGG
jgi:hypothetical protein